MMLARVATAVMGLLGATALSVSAASAEIVSKGFNDHENCPEMIIVRPDEAMICAERYEANHPCGDVLLSKVKAAYELAVGKTEINRRKCPLFVSESDHKVEQDVRKFANVAEDVFRCNFDHAPLFKCDDGNKYSSPLATYKSKARSLYDVPSNIDEWADDCLHRDLSNIPVDEGAWLAEDGGKVLYHSQILSFRVGIKMS